MEAALKRTRNLNVFMRNFADVVRLPEPKMVQPDLHKMIYFITKLMELNAAEKQVKFEHYLARNNFTIDGDEQQMEQVLINIVKNAIEAVGEKGIVTFTSHASLKATIISNKGWTYYLKFRSSFSALSSVPKKTGRVLALHP